MAENAVLFADRTNRRIHELVYDGSQQTVVAPDLTKLADHITSGGVVQSAMQRSSWPIDWWVRGDGEMASLYYSHDYGIAAWSRFVTDGQVKSACVIPTASGGVDRVWLCVYRDPNYYIEYISDVNLEADVNDGVYVDSSLSWNGGEAVHITNITKGNPGVVTLSTWPTREVNGVSVNMADGDNIRITDVNGMTQVNDVVFSADDCNVSAKTLTLDNSAGSADWSTAGYTAYSSGGHLTIVENSFGGLGHLEGKTVQALVDGSYNGTETVSAGTATFDDYYNKVTIGLGYTTTIEPIEIDTMIQGGSTAPFGKRVVRLAASLYRSVGGKYGPSATQLRNIPWARRVTATDFEVAPPAQTGTVVLEGFGGSRLDATYRLVQDEPFPFAVRALYPVFEVGQ